MDRSARRCTPKWLGLSYLLVVLSCVSASTTAQTPDDVRATPGWTLTGGLNAARYGHTATLLQNGKVLVAGGDWRGSAELYDPVTGTWSYTGSLNRPSTGALLTAERLPDGSVLVIGGGTSERYDPQSGTWTFVGAVTGDTSNAVTLSDGRVLVAGGYGSADFNGQLVDDVKKSTAVFDPTTRTWSSGPDLNFARYWSSATVLVDGRVLVARGSDDGDLGGSLSSAEIYDPVSSTWAVAGAVGLDDHYVHRDFAPAIWPGAGVTAAPSVFHTATRLNNGEVLLAGGYTGGVGGCCTIAVSTLLDPATLTSTRIGDLAAPRYSHTATRLPNGDVLVVGGQATQSSYPTLRYLTLDSAELLPMGASAWSSAPSLNVPRSRHTATVLADGRVLVVGGMAVGASYGSVPLDSAEIYDPSSAQTSVPCGPGKNHYILGCLPLP